MRSSRGDTSRDASPSGTGVRASVPALSAPDRLTPNRLSLPMYVTPSPAPELTSCSKSSGSHSSGEISPVASFDFDHQLPSTRFPSNEPLPTIDSSEEEDSVRSTRMSLSPECFAWASLHCVQLSRPWGVWNSMTSLTSISLLHASPCRLQARFGVPLTAALRATYPISYRTSTCPVPTCVLISI